MGGRKGRQERTPPSQPIGVVLPKLATPLADGFVGHQDAARRGSKVHLAVDTLSHLLALPVTAANEQDRCPVHTLAENVQEVTGDAVELAYVDQGYTGAQAAQAARSQERLCIAAQALGSGA